MFPFIVIVYVKRDLGIQTTNTKFNSLRRLNKQ
jgi:hypothetical protein